MKKYSDFIFAHCGNPDFNLAFLMCEANENIYFNPNGGINGWDARFIKIWENTGKSFPLRFDKLIWGSDNLLEEKCFENWSDFFKRNGAEKYIPDFFGELAKKILSL